MVAFGLLPLMDCSFLCEVVPGATRIDPEGERLTTLAFGLLTRGICTKVLLLVLLNSLIGFDEPRPNATFSKEIGWLKRLFEFNPHGENGLANL